MTAHPPRGWTAGEWTVEADMRSERFGDSCGDDGWREYLAGWNVVVAGESEIIGCEGIIPGEHAEANARLIAAAPDQHEALVDLVQLVKQIAPEYAESTVVANAEAALARANPHPAAGEQ